MDELKLTVSHSELETFLTCERQHYYAYGLNLTSIGKAEALERGTFGHAAVEQVFNYRLENPDADPKEAYAKAYAWMIKQADEDPDKFDYMNEIIPVIKNFEKQGGLSEFTILAVEVRQEVPITENISMSLVIDLIVRDKNGKVGVIDHKFIARNYYQAQLEVMPQLPRYIVALRSQDLPVDWVAYSEFNWKAKLWHFERVEVSEARIQTVAREFQEAARRVMEKRWDLITTGSLEKWSQEVLRTYNNLVCDRCNFRRLCVAEQNNAEPQFVLDMFYRVREKREANGHESASGTSGSDDSDVTEVS